MTPMRLLRALIFDRHIAPDSWMAIDVLARDLGVSQTPIREALARLESEGLVIRKENGRYRTEPLLTKELVPRALRGATAARA